MGNFEKLSVLVIVVIIVMILVVAIYEWTGSPSDGASAPEQIAKVVDPNPMPTPDPFVTPTPTPGPAAQDGKKASLDGGKTLKVESKPEDWFKGELIPQKVEKIPGVEGTELPSGDKPGPVTPVDGKVEGTEIPETTHVVASGDTLGAISKKYYGKASLYARIEEANPGVTATSLRVGQKLKIPALKVEAGKPAPALAAATKSDDTASESSGERPVPGKEYKVKASDTWERISKAAYKTSERWPEIYVKNMKQTPSPRDLRAGLVLTIPR